MSGRKKIIGFGITTGIIIILLFTIFLPFRADVEIGSSNPASKYCLENGGSSFIITTQTHTGEINEEGICKFPDGSQCEEWKFFRDECKPGS